MSETKAFISSTSVDLPAYRQAVIEACLGRGYFPVGMEHWSAKDADAVTVCLSELEDCQLFIGIYAFRYGWIPPGRNVSICELEYDRAKEKGIPRLLFFADENAAWPPKMVDKGDSAVKLDAFKERIGAERVGAFFGSNHELRAEVVQALADCKSTHLNPNHVATPRKGPEIPPRPEPGPADGANPPIGLTPLQKMLFSDLCSRWREICSDPQRRKVKVIENTAEPRSPEAVFRTAKDAAVEDSLGVLLDLAECVNGDAVAHSSAVFQIVRGIALVAAEQYILDYSKQNVALKSQCHHPIPEQDPTLAAIVAAAIFSFGLHFKPDNPSPINVIESNLPQSEFGNPGEEGVALARTEAYRAAYRVVWNREPNSAASVTKAWDQRVLTRANELLGCTMVLGLGLRQNSAHPLASEEARKQLAQGLAQHGIPVFFRASSNAEREAAANELMATLIDSIIPYLPVPKPQPQETPPTDDQTPSGSPL